MARQLWLLRHADAEPHGTRPDPERRLTERGERQARVAGRALTRMGVVFETVLSSPKERALRTAALALQERGEAHREGEAEGVEQVVSGSGGGPEIYPPLREGFGTQQALAALAGVRAGGRLLLVGHEPDFSNLVWELAGARIDLKKGGLAVVRLGPAQMSANRLSGGVDGGELVLLLRPAELALIADLATFDV
jgi:phosphohistidine phosphatase